MHFGPRVAAGAVLGFAQIAAGQYEMRLVTMDAGAGALAGGTLSFRTTIGQAESGAVLMGPTLDLEPGFWPGVMLAPPPTYFLVPTDVSTIQGAIDMSLSDPASLIEVLPGTYAENIDLLGKALALRSFSGDPDDTIIDGGASGRVVSCDSGEGADTVIEGLTIRNGASNIGAGFFVANASPTVRRCVVRDNTVTNSGGGVGLLTSGAPTFSDCRFHANHATANAGGAYASGAGCAPVFVNCLFDSNSADLQGGATQTGSGAVATLTNCTIVFNSAGSSGGGLDSNPGASHSIGNCVLWGNSPDQMTGAGTIGYSDVQAGVPAGATDAGGNLALDPLFADADGPDDIAATIDDDFKLSAGSPCIDAANNSDTGLVGVTFDLALNPRFYDDPATPDTGVGPAPIVDMGAFEFVGSPCTGDIDGDGDTDVFDFAVFAPNFGTSGLPPFTNGDLDGDGDIDVFDFGILAPDFGCTP